MRVFAFTKLQIYVVINNEFCPLKIRDVNLTSIQFLHRNEAKWKLSNPTQKLI